MLQDESVQFNFPIQPSLVQFVFQLSMAWLIALTLMAIGIYVFYGMKNIWIRLTAVFASVLGGTFCFLLGISFTPFNHHRYGWNSSDRNLNDKIDWAVFLAVWGLSLLLFWVVKKVARRSTQQIESNEN